MCIFRQNAQNGHVLRVIFLFDESFTFLSPPTSPELLSLPMIFQELTLTQVHAKHLHNGFRVTTSLNLKNNPLR